MVILGSVYIVALVTMITALLVREDHTYRGLPAAINVICLFASGLALALRAVGV